MNPFRSSNPNLSSSDRTRDIKSKYIYAAAKKKFQSGKGVALKILNIIKKELFEVFLITSCNKI